MSSSIDNFAAVFINARAREVHVWGSQVDPYNAKID
jgi:hypothetical protein